MNKEERDYQKRAREFYKILEEKDKAAWSAREKHWRAIAYEFKHMPGTMSQFYRHLCEAIAYADLINTNKLSKVYPELVRWIRERQI